MNTPVLAKRIAEASPRPMARITGVVYLLYFLTAASGELFVRGMIVSSDPAATAANIPSARAIGSVEYGSGSHRHCAVPLDGANQGKNMSPDG